MRKFLGSGSLQIFNRREFTVIWKLNHNLSRLFGIGTYLPAVQAGYIEYTYNPMCS